LTIEKETLKSVFDKHFNALSAFGYKYVSDADVAQDMVQEAFVALWEKIEDFNQQDEMRAFLYTAVRNKCLNYLKHLSVKEKHQEGLIYELESEHLFSLQIIEEESFNQLYIEIEALPPSARKIILLALKGMKNKEIAEFLEISENTVKTQKKIAYSKLKQKLSPNIFRILFF